MYSRLGFSNAVDIILKWTFMGALEAHFFKYPECICGSDRALWL